MRGLLLLLISLTSFSYSQDYVDIDVPYSKGKWFDDSFANEHNLHKVIQIIERSSLGRDLIQKSKEQAKANGKTLYEVILPGESSLTDTTLLRRYSKSNPSHVNYINKSVVYLNKELSLKDAVLDLVHELTHFVYRGPFNPYKQNYHLDEFIKMTIEGEGGELHAFINECKVKKQIFKEDSIDGTCSEIVKNGKVEFEVGKERFYRSGQYHSRITEALKKFNIQTNSFPYLTEKSPVFISSAYGVPYTMAAVMEYASVMQRACQNDERRIVLFEQHLFGPDRGRSPASEKQSIKDNYQQLRKNFNTRCSQPFNWAVSTFL